MEKNEFWPTYFWMVRFYPYHQDESGRKYKEISGYCNSASGALSKVSEYSDPNCTSEVGIQKQWFSSQDLPLLNWTRRSFTR